ncbi:hypothetical protein LO763_22245 [Glycomyces sp. A-F 0318]|uniref:hypothetical protein n=1 Tax=Glycomyces amatae TaxID=2881355 RepID=UPI001E3D9D3C|nr:hypothetical protein [Glycomyces amatae]MCD0446339.1 hypothetical protein [Glycomyces amatae]
MQLYLTLWSEAVTLSAAAGDDDIVVPAPVSAALTLTGNATALGVYALLVHRVAAGEPVTLDALMHVVSAPPEARERVHAIVQFLFDLAMIPAVVAAEAGASVAGREAVHPQ